MLTLGRFHCWHTILRHRHTRDGATTSREKRFSEQWVKGNVEDTPSRSRVKESFSRTANRFPSSPIKLTARHRSSLPVKLATSPQAKQLRKKRQMALQEGLVKPKTLFVDEIHKVRRGSGRRVISGKGSATKVGSHQTETISMHSPWLWKLAGSNGF